MTKMTEEQFELARASGDALLRSPRAKSAHYDAGRNRIIVRLTTGIELGFAPQDAEGLQNATADDLKAVKVESFGLGLHFPTLDAGLYVPALLDGLLGSKKWMEALRKRELGRKGAGRRKVSA